jgi:hypothetical protein
LSTFWSKALEYSIPGPPGAELTSDQDPFDAWHAFLAKMGVPEAAWNSRSAIEDTEGRGPRIFFQQVPDDKSGKNPVHLDVRAAPGLQGGERMAALESESARLVSLGATRIERHEPTPPTETGHIVMEDPEGNVFCLD